MKYKKFHGKRIEDVAKHRKDLSSYNKNYYEDEDGNLILAESDDDNSTYYSLVTADVGAKVTFAESFCSQDDVIEVFDEFLEEE